MGRRYGVCVEAVGRCGVSRLHGYLQHEDEKVEEAEGTLERLVGNRVWCTQETWLGHSRRWKYCAGGQARV